MDGTKTRQLFEETHFLTSNSDMDGWDTLSHAFDHHSHNRPY